MSVLWLILEVWAVLEIPTLLASQTADVSAKGRPQCLLFYCDMAEFYCEHLEMIARERGNRKSVYCRPRWRQNFTFSGRSGEDLPLCEQGSRKQCPSWLYFLSVPERQNAHLWVRIKSLVVVTHSCIWPVRGTHTAFILSKMPIENPNFASWNDAYHSPGSPPRKKFQGFELRMQTSEFCRCRIVFPEI